MQVIKGFLSPHTEWNFHPQCKGKVSFEKRILIIHLGFIACTGQSGSREFN